MKKGKRLKPKFPVEYRLLIIPDGRKGRPVTRFALRTVNEFTSFRYEIVVEQKVSGRSIRLNIHGLRAPQVTIPGMGPAVFEVEYEDLRGAYTVIVSKLDREENQFSILISPEKTIVTESPESRFVEIATEAEDW